MVSRGGQQRSYKLSIVDEDTGEILVITNPLTLEFNIVRNNFSELNTASLGIYNLSEKNRNFVRKDFHDPAAKRKIRLEIGYGENLSLAFQGTISKSQSIRNGVNFVTQIEANDGYYQSLTSKYKNTFAKGTPKSEIIADIIKQLANEGLYSGSIAKTDEILKRGVSYSGSTIDILSVVAKGKHFIDNSQINILDDDQAVYADIVVIDSENLINTPTIEAFITSFEIFLDTTIVAGQRLQLNSKNFNNRTTGLYRINGIIHKGVISETMAGRNTTTLSCSPGLYKVVQKDGTVTNG